MSDVPILAESICDEMQELYDQATELEEQGEMKAAGELYLKAWEMLPEPKNSWDASAQYADITAEFFLEAGDVDRALEFSRIALESDITDFDPAKHRTAGKAEFEAGNREKAMELFRVAYERGGKRAFANEDPKYFKFFMANR